MDFRYGFRLQERQVKGILTFLRKQAGRGRMCPLCLATL